MITIRNGSLGYYHGIYCKNAKFKEMIFKIVQKNVGMCVREKEREKDRGYKNHTKIGTHANFIIHQIFIAGFFAVVKGSTRQLLAQNMK